MLTSPFRPCEGPPTYQEEYRSMNYVHVFVETELGPQIVAPNTPYVAAAGRCRLYFIDTRFDAATAQHIKEQIELATVPEKDSFIYIDDVTVTAEVRNTATGETIAFDPVFAKIFFARTMNRCNPSLNLHMCSFVKHL